MTMSKKQKIYWVERTIPIFKDDKTLNLRLEATWPLYGYRWILIILKEALKYNKIYENDNKQDIKKIENSLNNKLIKSNKIIQKINKNKLKCPYVR